MPARDRTNAFLATAAGNANLWIDYDPAAMTATEAAVQNEGATTVYGEIQTVKKVAGRDTFGRSFPPGITVLTIPPAANVGVVIDGEGVPALTGLARITFRDPA